MTLETTLADLRERVTVLRYEGHTIQAASVERAIEQLVACLPEYLVLLSEGEAVTYSGRSIAYLRARFGHRAPRSEPGRHGTRTCKRVASRCRKGVVSLCAA